MADTTYYVNVVYKMDTSQAERGISGLQGSFSRLARFATVALAGIGIEKLVSGFAKINSEVENATIAIAGMFQAMGAGGIGKGPEEFERAMGASEALVQKMRQDARDLPGEFTDLLDIFQGGIAGGKLAGKSILDTEGMAAKLMAVFIPQGLNSATVSREWAMMLEGHATSQNVLWRKLKMQPAFQGMDTRQFNGLGVDQRWDKIAEAMKGFEHMIDRFKNTWTSLLSGAIDFGKLLIQIGGESTFAALKNTLRTLLKFFSEPTTIQWAYTVNLWLGHLYHRFVQFAVEAWPYIKTFFVAFADAFLKATGYVVGGLDLLRNAFVDVFEYLGFTVDGPASSLATLGRILGGLIPIIYAVKKAFDIFKMIGALFSVPTVAILGIAAAIMLVISYFDDLMDKFHMVFALFQNKTMATMLLGEWKMLGLVPKGTTVGDIQQMARSATGDTRLRQEERNAHLRAKWGNDGPGAHVNEKFSGIFDSIRLSPMGKALEDWAKVLNAKTAPQKGNTNVNVRLEQNIETNADPEMIRIKTAEAINEALIHPITSGNNHFAVLP